MNTVEIRESAEFKTMAKLVASADAALVPLTVGRGVDSHSKPIAGIDDVALRALRDAQLAGELATALLSRLGAGDEQPPNPS